MGFFSHLTRLAWFLTIGAEIIQPISFDILTVPLVFDETHSDHCIDLESNLPFHESLVPSIDSIGVIMQPGASRYIRDYMFVSVNSISSFSENRTLHRSASLLSWNVSVDGLLYSMTIPESVKYDSEICVWVDNHGLLQHESHDSSSSYHSILIVTYQRLPSLNTLATKTIRETNNNNWQQIDLDLEEKHDTLVKYRDVNLFKIGKLGSNSYLNITVENANDTASLNNASNCEMAGEGLCNLRSSISYCMQESELVTETLVCDINFVVRGDIMVNPSLGEISINDTFSASRDIAINLIGHGCHLYPMSSLSAPPTRLVSVNGSSINISFSNMSISGFGSDDLDGGAISFHGVNSMSLRYVEAYDNKGRYGGVVLLDQVVGSDSSVPSIDGCTFYDNQAERGGVIYLTYNNHNMVIVSSVFDNNRAVDDGGVFYIDHDNHYMLMRNCIITNNYAGNHGGVFYIYTDNNGYQVIENTLTNNHAGYAGGVFFINHSNFNYNVIKSTFSNNTAGHVGGVFVIYTDNNGYQVIESTFSNNHAGYAGGVFFINDNNDNYNVIKSTFSNNTADYRGGVFVIYTDNDRYQVIESTFTNNHAGTYGGVFYIYIFNDRYQVNKSSFISNHAGYDGGVFFIDYQNYEYRIIDCRLLNNSAGGTGGAIHSESGNVIMILDRNYFYFNSARSGGAIFMSSVRISLISNNELVGNKAYDYGGAIVLDCANINVTLANCSVSHNSASNGGGVYIGYNNKNVTIESCTIYSNIARDSSGGGVSVVSYNSGVLVLSTIVHYNSALFSGGGFYFASNNQITVTNASIMLNQAAYGAGVYFGEGHSNIAISDCNFTSNSGESGGGLYVDRFSELFVIKNCHFLSNQVTSFGGGMLYLAYGVNVTECTFSTNVAGDGGGLMMGGSALRSVSVLGCNFTTNVVTGRGGGMQILASNNVSVVSTTFLSNVARSGGGMALVSTDTVVVQDCVIYGNSASELGGGILGNIVSNAALRFVHMGNNTAVNNGGGLVLVESKSVSLESCWFESNIALNGSGGGMWLRNSRLVFYSSNTFAGNQALLGGGGCVYWDHNSGMQEPEGLNVPFSFDCDLTNCAQYGSALATNPVYVLFTNSTFNSISNSTSNLTFKLTSVDVSDYESGHLPSFVVEVQDYYHQRIETLSGADFSVTLSIGEDCTYLDSDGYIGGVIAGNPEAGRVRFSQAEGYCAPGYEMGLDATFRSADIEIVSHSLLLAYRYCETGEYYSSSVCKVCEDGSYSLKDNSNLTVTSCSPCPSHSSSCEGASIQVEEGYWRVNNASTSILACPYGARACAGGWVTGSSSCKQGYEGALCAVCAEGYFYSSSAQQCMYCSGSSAKSWNIVTVMVAAMLVVVLVSVPLLRLYFKRTYSLTVREYVMRYWMIRSKTLSAESGAHEVKREILQWKSVRRQVTRRIKLFTSMFQVLSALPFVLDLTMPQSYSESTSALNIVNLNLFQDFGAECASGSYDYVTLMLVSTITPAVMLMALLAVYVASNLISGSAYRRHKGEDEGEELSGISIASFLSSSYHTVFLYITYFTLPGICTIIFRVFPRCEDVDPEDVSSGSDEYMSADYSISCDSDRYWFAYYYALCMVVVYPIGVPLYYWMLLYRSRDQIKCRHEQTQVQAQYSESASLSSMNTLYGSYKPEFWYFEVVETFFRLYLTGFLVLVIHGTALQIIIGMVVTVMYMKMCSHYKPFIDDSLDSLKEVIHWQILLVLELALLLRMDAFDQYKTWISVLSVFAVFASLMYDGVRLIYSYILLSQKACSPFGVRDKRLDAAPSCTTHSAGVENPLFEKVTEEDKAVGILMTHVPEKTLGSDVELRQLELRV